MTVGEIKRHLAKADDKMHVVVYYESPDGESSFYGVTDVSVTTGTPRRHPDGRAGFTFDRNGPATWMFLSVAED